MPSDLPRAPASDGAVNERAQDSILRLLNPRSVAIIGASDDSGKFGGRVIEYLLKFGFSGTIVPINPRATTVRGMPSYPSIRLSPCPIDVAVIATPARHAVAAIEQCAEAGVDVCVIITAQFAEAGEEGARRQVEVVATARAHGMRILGPNCLGYVNMHGRTAMSPTLALSAMAELRPGGIGLVSQSGALMGSLIAVGDELGARFSACVSVGNQCDLEIADFIDYMAQDPNTKVICVYVEGLSDPVHFLQAVERARASGKPLLMVKAGRTNPGARAVKSHTASLAGSYAAFGAVCEAHGVLVMDDIFDMLAVAECLNRHGRVRGDGIAVFSASGGAGALLTDALSDGGLRVATLNALTMERLAPLLPDTHRHLPIDFGVARLTAPQSGPATHEQTVQTVLGTVMDDPDVAAGIVILTTGAAMEGIARAVAQIGSSCGKPLLFVNTAGQAGATSQTIMKEAGHLSFRRPQEALRVIATLVADFKGRGGARAVARETLALDKLIAELPDGTLNEHETKELLFAAGVSVTREQLARSAEEAARIAGEMGFPVVLKAQARGLSHKSDAGGVVLGLLSAEAVRGAYRKIEEHLKTRVDAILDGCLVQEMVQADVEIIVGTKWDDQFGAMVLIGSGGILVELLKDFHVVPAPIAASDAVEVLRTLKLAPLLTGYRGKAGVDLDAIGNVIARISQLAVNLGSRLRELDVNPLLATKDRVVVADARAVIEK